MPKKLVVLTAPDPRLKIKASPIEAVTDDIRTLMDDMAFTLYAEDALGLAATQVGVNKRVIVIDTQWSNETDRNPLKMANPELIEFSDEVDTSVEACLSVPEQTVKITRPATARVRYLNEYNEPVECEVEGLLAKCIQHEIDHLNGKLIFDHASPLKRQLLLGKLTRLKKMSGK